MYYVYKYTFGVSSPVGSYDNERVAKAKAKKVKGTIHRGGYDGQIIYDYRG